MDVVDLTDHLLEDPANVARADEDGVGLAQRRRPPRLELDVAPHRVLELGAVRLHPEARARRGGDRGAHQHVIREHEIGRQLFLQRGRVHRDVALPLCRRHVLEQDGLEALVAVEHEDRQPGVELRPNDLRPAEVEPLGRGILADHHDLVPRARPLARDRPRVDVRAGALEQVPVPEKDPHGTSLCPCRLCQMEIQRVQELDGRVRGVHLNVPGHVE